MNVVVSSALIFWILIVFSMLGIVLFCEEDPYDDYYHDEEADDEEQEE